MHLVHHVCTACVHAFYNNLPCRPAWAVEAGWVIIVLVVATLLVGDGCCDDSLSMSGGCWLLLCIILGGRSWSIMLHYKTSHERTKSSMMLTTANLNPNDIPNCFSLLSSRLRNTCPLTLASKHNYHYHDTTLQAHYLTYAMYLLVCWYLLRSLSQSSWDGSSAIGLVGRYSCPWRMLVFVNVRPCAVAHLLLMPVDADAAYCHQWELCNYKIIIMATANWL